VLILFARRYTKAISKIKYLFSDEKELEPVWSSRTTNLPEPVPTGEEDDVAGTVSQQYCRQPKHMFATSQTYPTFSLNNKIIINTTVQFLCFRYFINFGRKLKFCINITELLTE
jgi:hypothetical protein